MAKVLLVTVGDYSDYRVVAAFDEEHRAEAEQMSMLIGGGVEEEQLNPPALADPRMDFFRVVMYRSGEALIKVETRLDPNGDRWREVATFRTKKDHGWERDSYWRLIWQGYAQSPEHARRHVEELRRQILTGQRPAGVEMGKN